jgi:hypothetical protein
LNESSEGNILCALHDVDPEVRLKAINEGKEMTRKESMKSTYYEDDERWAMDFSKQERRLRLLREHQKQAKSIHGDGLVLGSGVEI